MNTNLFTKDLRRLWPWLALAAAGWLLLALPLLATALPMALRSGLYFVAVCVGTALTVLALERLLHEDPFAGTAGFLATRPVDRQALLLHKLTFAFVFLVLPGAVVRLAIYAAFAPALPLAGLGIQFLQEILFALTLLAVFLLPALWTTQLHRMILLVVGGTVLIGVALASTQRFSMRGPSTDPLDGASVAMWFVIIQLSLILGAGAAALSFVRSRRLFASGLLLAVILGLLFASLDQIESLILRQKFPAPDGAALSIKPLRKPFLQTNIDGHGRQDRVTAQLVLEGLPITDCVDVVRTDVTFATQAGDVRSSRMVQQRGSSPPHLKNAALGMFGILPSDQHPDSFSVTLLESRDVRDPIQLESLRGSVQSTISRATRLATLPLKVGATALAAPFRFRVERVLATGPSLEVTLSIDAFNSIAYPLNGSFLKNPPFVLALTSPQQIKPLVVGNNRSSWTALGPCSLQSSHFQWRAEKGAPLAADLVAQGRIEIIAALPLAEISLPLSFATTR